MSGPNDATLPDPTPTFQDPATHPDDVDPLIGAILGAYRIDGVLGRGGMGVVYRGWDLRLERPVAVKTVRFDHPQARLRFHREARAQARLRHRNVVPVHVVAEHGGLTYLVMDFVRGESLHAVLARNGVLPETRALEIVDAIAAALEAAHAAGLIHRDVKPANVLVEPDGHVMLTDFGLAKDVRGAGTDDVPDAPLSKAPRSLTHPGSVLGTPAYLSPEQSRGERVDHRADMYALGITLHELLYGRRPTPEQHEPAVPLSKATNVLMSRLLAPHAHERFATYRELRDALARARGVRVTTPTLATRAMSFVLDLCVFGLAAGILSGWGGALVGHIRGDMGWKPLIAALAWPFAAVIGGVVEGTFGTTLGKRLMRLRTVDASTGRKPSAPRCLARSLLKMVPLYLVSLQSIVPFPKGVAGFWLVGTVVLLGLPALAKSRAALHDRLVRTRVELVIEADR